MRADELAIVIDNSLTVCRAIGDVLHRRRVAALISQSLAQACDAFAGAQPDAVFLDLFLQDECGVAGVSRARAVWPKAPVVAMSAEADTGPTAALARARAAGAEFLLPKPFKPDELDAVFEDACALTRSGARPPRALIIDDSRTVRAFCRRGLEAAGWRVLEADSMEAALGRLDCMIIDVAVIDIFMPGMGGIAGISQLRARADKLGIVAMSSGLESRMDSDKALAAALLTGAAQTLAKPFGPADLVTAARAAARVGVRAGKTGVRIA